MDAKCLPYWLLRPVNNERCTVEAVRYVVDNRILFECESIAWEKADLGDSRYRLPISTHESRRKQEVSKSLKVESVSKTPGLIESANPERFSIAGTAATPAELTG